jgi:hypothetical protein
VTRGAWLSTVLIFTALTVALTWPVSARLTTSLPGDYGDPLFISWVMTWVAERVSAAAVDPASLRTFWDAPIFHPEPAALTFSEHFVPQTMLVLPVYWATHNPILCYNLAFLISFVLTGVGVSVLTRALTGSLTAGIVGGVVATFNEYRLVWEVAHLQTLSIYWFPFVLFGVHRYLVTRARLALAGAAAAWLALNLSSVYYLAYCAPFIAIFTVADVARLGRLQDGRTWRDLTIAGALVAAVTTPWLLPYAATQRRYGFERTLEEVVAHSATVDNYVAALPRLIVPLVLAVLALAGAAAGLRQRDSNRSVDRRRDAAAVTLWLTLSALAVWLSLGPLVRFHGAPLDLPAIYPMLASLPGYDGLRVPARTASIFLIGLGVLAGYGVAVLTRQWRLVGSILGIGAVTIFLWQGRHQRVPLDQPLPSPGLRRPPPELTPRPHLPPIYEAVRALPASAVLVEFPFGDSWYDTRYMFFAAMHGKPLLNGYSGVFPPSFRWRQGSLWRPPRDPARARAALAGATHAVVHRAAWPDAFGETVAMWLVGEGARPIFETHQVVLYELSAVATTTSAGQTP